MEKKKTEKPFRKKIPNLHIGTSGWSYGGWDNIFYPEGVKTTYDRLAFYAQYFDTVEVNYSFRSVFVGNEVDLNSSQRMI